MTGKELQDWVQLKIPISQAMQFSISEIKTGEVELRIPLAPHRNHKGTAFGGSLYNACVLACYSLAHSDLSASGVSTDQFVISDGKIKYMEPVAGDFEVRVVWRESDREPVLKGLKRKGRVRWNLQAEVFCDFVKCAVFEGRFVLP